MIKIILDTNVLVSAVLSPLGPPARVVEMVADRAVQLVVSPGILAEYEEVLGRRKFALAPAIVRTILGSLRNLAIEIHPSEPTRCCRDPSDEKFMECASGAGADYLVTGNQRDFPRVFQGVRVLSPSAFLRAMRNR